MLASQSNDASGKSSLRLAQSILERVDAFGLRAHALLMLTLADAFAIAASGRLWYRGRSSFGRGLSLCCLRVSLRRVALILKLALALLSLLRKRA
jgi:hypothetical protein